MTDQQSAPFLRNIVAIVDDDAASRESLRFLLTVLGRGLRTFASAKAFLEDESGYFGCLLLDYHMPVMNGLELVVHLRSRNNRIPVMLISGGLTPELRERAEEIGVDLVCDKPPAPEMITDFIDRSLQLTTA